MSVAIITDQHFGARNDSRHFLEFYEKFYTNSFFPSLDASGISNLLILGDTFDRRKYVNFSSLQAAKQMFFDKLAERNITVNMLVGNHDIYYKNTNEVNSPELLLQDYSNINIISTPQTIEVEGTLICMIPWICPDNYEASMAEIKNTRAEICMGHLEIGGFQMYRGMESHGGLSSKVFEKFEVVFSGHYHHKSSKENITYLGTPYELTWQDYADQKGFHYFDLGTRKLQFEANPYSMYCRIEYDDKNKEPIDLNSIRLDEKYIKLVVVNKTDYYKFDIFVNTLYTKGCHDIKIVEDFSDFENSEIGSDVDLEDTLSILSTYIDSTNTDLDKEKIKNYMKTLYTEAVNSEVV